MYFFNFITILLIFSTGCFNQEPQSIKSVKETAESRRAKKACLKSNLKTNLLEQNNSVAIFECIGWSKEYPNIYRLIKDFPEQTYAKSIKLPNTLLFASKAKKDKFFTILEKNGASDDFRGLNSLIRLALKDKGVMHALDKVNQELSKKGFNESLWSLLKSESFNEQTLKTLLMINDNVTLSRADLLPFEYISKNTQFKNLLVSMIDSTVVAITKENVSKMVGDFIYRDNWPYLWLQQISDQQFLELFLFVGDLPENISENSKIVRDNIFSEFVCREYSGTYVFDHGKELYQRMQNLVKMDINSFYADYMDLLQSYSLFKNVCSRRSKTDKSVKSFMVAADQVFTVAHKAFSMHGGFELIKNVAAVTLDNTQKSSASLLDLMYSEFFNNYSELIKFLQQQENYEDYLSLFTNQARFVENKTLMNASKMMEIFAKESEVRNALFTVWDNLENDSKLTLLEVGLDLFIDLENTSSISSLLDELMKAFPGLLNVTSSNLTSEEYTLAINHINKFVKNSAFQTEIKNFFSSKSFFQLTELMGQYDSENPLREGADSRTPQVDRASYVLDANEELEACFAWLGDKLSGGVDFWSLIDGYPEKCERNVGNYLSTHVLNWTLIIDDKFLGLTGRKFSVPYGVIAPDMMEYYLDLVLLVNKYALHGDKYVARIVNTIDKHLFEYGLIESLDNGVTLTNQINQQTNFLSSFLYKVAVRDSDRDIDLDEDLKHLLRDWYYFKPAIGPVPSKPICEMLNGDVIPLTCLNVDIVENYYFKFAHHLLAKNERGINPLRVLLDSLYPEKKFKLPFDARWIHYYTLTLDHLVRFIYDLTDEKYKKKIKFYGPDSVQVLDATLGERLEVVIREINFLDNFYGAHFMNTTSRAKKYKAKVYSLKSQMALLGRFGNVLRRRGLLPPESEWMVKNVLESYDSLAEVANKFEQPDIKAMTYTDLMQTLMTVAVKSSEEKANSFNAIRFPKPELVKNHRGKLITMGTELSIISRIGKLLRSFYPNKSTILEDEDFQRVSANLHKYFSYDVAYDLLTNILESENTSLLVRDLFEVSDKLTAVEIKQLISITGNIFKIFDVKESGALDKYASIIKSLIKHYPMIRSQLAGVDVSAFISGLDSFSSVFVNYKKREAFKYFGSLIEEVLDENLQIIPQIIADPMTWNYVQKVAIATNNYIIKSPDIENAELIIDLIQDDKFDFETLVTVVNRVYKEEGNLDYFDQILKVMAHREKSHSNIYLALEEIFQDKKTPLIEFLESVLSKVSHKN